MADVDRLCGGMYSLTTDLSTLSGRVEARAQRRMAEINAFEGGVIRVIDNLKIRH
jgi:hypothetical protein